MKKNLNKDCKSVWNYRAKHKLPSKRQEQDFVYNLKPSQKTYTVFDVKPPEELWCSGNWDGVAYSKKVRRGWLQKTFLWLAKLCS